MDYGVASSSSLSYSICNLETGVTILLPQSWSQYVGVEFRVYHLLALLVRDDSHVATNTNCGVASSSSWSNSICNPETGVTKIEGTSKNTSSFQR
jgi:hypothetical protein